MKVWITSALLSLAWAVSAAAQDDDVRRCEQYRESNPDLVLQYCSSAIQSGHLSATQLDSVLNTRGLAFLMKSDFEHAIQDFDQAVRLAPDDAEAHDNLGVALMGKGDADGAIKEYQEALHIRPDYAEAHYNLGNVLELKGNLDAAIQQYREALRIKSDYAAAHDSLVLPLWRRAI